MDLKHRFHQAHHALTAAKNVLVISHRKPDGDTLSAACGLMTVLAKRGIAVQGFCADRFPDQYAYLPSSERITDDPSVFAAPRDLVVVVDSGDLAYAGVDRHFAALPPGIKVVNIDHHVVNTMFGHVNAVDTQACSASEVVYRVFSSNGEPIDADAATCFLTGILTDTNGFNNPATSARTFAAAADLLKAGAGAQLPWKRLIRNRPLPSLRLWGQILARLKFDERHGLASTALFRSDFSAHAEDESLEGVSNFLNLYLDVPVVLVLKENADGKVKGSFRSTGRNVAALAERLGGGGHRLSAGFSLKGRITEREHGWTVEAD